MTRSRPLAIAPLLLFALSACDDGSRPARDGDRDAAPPGPGDGSMATPDGAAGDGALPDGPPPLCPDAATPPDAAPPFQLSACERACDRVQDCSTDQCEGFTWATIGSLALSCLRACEPALAEAVLVADDCAAVQAAVIEVEPGYEEACASNPCLEACERLGGCIVDVCEGFAPPDDEAIAASCAERCRPEEVEWLTGAPTCQVIIDAIIEGDPAFAQECGGQPRDCPEPALCADWATKLTGCMKAHCGEENAGPYEAGLIDALGEFCANDPRCPPLEEIEATLSPEVSCSDPGLAEVGPAPPFTTLCERGGALDLPTLRQACGHMLACPELAGFVNPGVCMVFVAMRPDARQRIECFADAGARCRDLLGCLEGW